MIPVLPLTIELEDKNQEGFGWAVWVVKDKEGRPFLTGPDKAGLEMVVVAMNEWQAARTALSDIVLVGFTEKVGNRYKKAREIARETLAGLDRVEVVEM